MISTGAFVSNIKLHFKRAAAPWWRTKNCQWKKLRRFCRLSISCLRSLEKLSPPKKIQTTWFSCSINLMSTSRWWLLSALEISVKSASVSRETKYCLFGRKLRNTAQAAFRLNQSKERVRNRHSWCDGPFWKNLFRVLFFLTFVISKVLPYLRILFTDQQRHFRCFLRRWWHSSIKTDMGLWVEICSSL